jgi:nucleoside phosphorylase
MLGRFITYVRDLLGDRPPRPPETPGHIVDFVIVTALPEERDAVLQRLSNVTKVSPTHDDVRVYFRATLDAAFPNGIYEKYEVVVACLSGMGRVQAATETGDAIRRWRPRYVIFVGIAGGIAENGPGLGDVLVATFVIDFELQKVTAEGPKPRFQPHSVDARLLAASQNVIGDQWVDGIKIRRPISGVPKVAFGPLATGDKVIESRQLISDLLIHFPKLIGVEMEAGGAAAATFQSALRPGFFMVRAVSDLADPNKESREVLEWRQYSCDVAATFTEFLLKSAPVPPIALDNQSARNDVAHRVARLSLAKVKSEEPISETDQDGSERQISGSKRVTVNRGDVIALTPTTVDRADGRIFISGSLRSILDRFRGMTNLSAVHVAEREYVGKWMKVKARVHNISPVQSGASAQIVVENDSYGGVDFYVYALFSGGELPAITHVQRGDYLTIIGRVSRIENYDIQLVDCRVF